jgi:hypothetical protein
MQASLKKHPTASNHGVYGFEAIQEFEHDSGLVEGIGYRNGRLVRYAAGSSHSSPFECEPITVAEALHWWAELHEDRTADSTQWRRDARARFLESASRSVAG